MSKFRWLILLACGLPLLGASFGRIVPVFGGASDLVLDEGRGRLYLTFSGQNLLQIYSLQQQKFLNAVTTDQTPLAAALSRDGRFLYVTCYASSLLDVIDLDSLTIANRVTLPAQPEGVAVANDGRVLISTAGSGTTVKTNVLLLYDPSPSAAFTLSSLPVAPPAPTPPTLPPPSGRPFLSTTSQLRATRDGSLIIGVNVQSTGSPTVFVYESASGTVLRSRAVVGSSNVLSISDDGTRFLAGPNLFSTATLSVLAQLNLANAPYPIPPGTNFNLQSNQGGSVFSPDGTTIYAAFDISPVQNPPAPTNASQLMMNDPNNLLIRMGFQLPENLAGKMVISSDGSNAYALSDSGFIILPLGTIFQSPLAVPSSDVLWLAGDPCSVAAQGTGTITLNNPGLGRISATAQLLQYTGINNQVSPGQASPATAPSVRSGQVAGSPQLTFKYNPGLGSGFGTFTPPHDFLIQSPEAINIPDRVRVYQNYHSSEAAGTILPIASGSTAATALLDIAYDATRQRVYLANAARNQVEVYDIAQQQLLAPIPVGQLPSSLALTPDGFTLYVANAGGESISIVDPDAMQVTDTVNFPPIPFNANLALKTPSAIAAGVSGLQILMSDGSLWEVIGNTAVPRPVSSIVGQTSTGLPTSLPANSTMAASADGTYILYATSTGAAYLLDAVADNFVLGRQVFTGATQTGYIGPVAAGPGGQFFVMDGILLNQSLVPQGGAAVPAGLTSAVAATGNGTYAVFSPPAVAANATSLPASVPNVRLVNAFTGSITSQVSALEGPLTSVTGTARVAINGRTMAVDINGSTAYVITASGLSILPLSAVVTGSRPLVNRNGAVSLASQQPLVAPNTWLSISGQNLALNDVAASNPLPTILGGACVTLNNIALPLFFTNTTLINAQIPPDLAPGTYQLVVHSVTNHVASSSQSLTVSKYAPSVFFDSNGRVMLYHADNSIVDDDNPANRDEPLHMYASGLGPTTGGAVITGMPSPSSPLAVASGVQVFFGRTDFKQAAVIVDSVALAPGVIGVYQLNLRVPGFHINSPQDLVTIRVGGVNSPSTGPLVPYVPVN
jgi:uncharacterized protein (TIGR03437 family)